MDATELDTILAALKAQMKGVSPEQFARMLDARKALINWGKLGFDGPMPHATELRGWGISLPDGGAVGIMEETVPKPISELPLPTAEEAWALLARLQALSEAQGDNDALLDTYSDISLWLDGDRRGPLPHTEELAALGLWPPKADGGLPLEAPDLEDSTPPFAPMGGDAPSVTPGGVRETTPPPNTEPGTPSVLREETAPPPPPSAAQQTAPATPVSDPDDHLQERYDDALAALEAGNYYTARGYLDELRLGVRSRLVGPVEAAYTDASVRLQENTERLARLAREIAERASRDFPRQRRAWEEVLRVNPEAAEANEALTQLTFAAAERELENQLERTLREATEAADNLQLPTLNELVGKVAAWRARGEEQPPTISEELYRRVRDLEQQVIDLRKATRQELGNPGTLAAGGYYYGAYREARTLLDQAVPTVVDVTGIFVPAGEEMPTAEFFKRARELYIPALTSLAGERLDKARAEREQYPERALETLEDAHKRLTDLVLTEADRDSLKPALDPILKEMEEVGERVKRFQSAKAKVVRAQDPTQTRTRTQALALLREARIEFPDYPDLELYIVQAEEEVAEVFATSVEDAMAQARREMERDEFAKAVETLRKARVEAAEQVPRPKPGSAMAARLAEVRELEREISEREGRYSQIMELLKSVDDSIRQFDEGSARALVSARGLLAQLSEAERRHPQVIYRLSDLASRQDDVGNWESGQQEYRLRNWRVAEEALRKVANGNTAHKEQAQRLADRALACRYAEEAVTAEAAHDWKMARERYEQAAALLAEDQAGTDADTRLVRQQCLDAVVRLRPLEQSDITVSRLIERATSLHQAAERVRAHRTHLRERVEPIEQYRQAADVLQEASTYQTTRSEGVSRLLQAVRRDWRSAYLAVLEEARSSSDLEVLQRAGALADVLSAAHLLFEEDKAASREVGIRALDVEYRELLERRPVPWELIEENRRQRLTTYYQARTSEVEEQYRNAVRTHIQDQVRIQQQQGGAQAARSYLTQQLQRPEVHTESSLMTILIELCWQQNDWAEAERIAVELSYHDQDESDVWRGLTRAARLFVMRMVPQGSAEIEVLRDRHAGKPALVSLVSNKERDFRQRASEELISQATTALARGTDDGYIEAAELYAQAAALAQGEDPRIKTGLSRLGALLGPGIRARCERVRALELANRPLAVAVQDADTLHATLSSIKRVAEQLQLQSEQRIQLDDALETLIPKRDRWKAVKEALDQATKAREQALRQPQPLTDEPAAPGGWDFSPVTRHLREAREAAGDDTNVLALARGVEDTVGRLETTADELVAAIRDFMKALREENFDQVDKKADEVAERWRQASQQAAWGGLDILVRYYYPWYGREEERLERHKQLTAERRTNLEQWSRWSKTTKERYADARARGLDIAKELDRLRDDYSMEEIVEMCMQCRRACDAFEGQIYSSPGQQPLSEKAKAAQAAILTDSWVEEVLGENGYRAQSIRVEAEANAEAERLTAPNGPLWKLRQIYNTQILPFANNSKKTVPEENIKRAHAALKECQTIDPHHKAVTDYAAKLQSLQGRMERR